MLHILYVATERRALSHTASATPRMRACKIRGPQTDCLCMYGLIVARLAGGILGVKHGVAAFAIQFLKGYYNAATCCCR